VKSPTWLLAFRRDRYSQTGEDGVVAKILEQLPETDHWCVEFGAWDGRWLSNTRRLVEEDGYSAVLIEGNAKRFADLRARYEDSASVTPVHAYVGWGYSDGLDSILGGLPVPADFDFLSIDIDGNDYHVWKAVTNYRPKVVCIEFNPTIPTPVEFIQPADRDTTIGSSLRSLLELGKEKGYEAVAVLDFNIMFVERKYFPGFEIGDNSAETMRASSESVALARPCDARVKASGAAETAAPVSRQLQPHRYSPLCCLPARAGAGRL
jgi:hypothetical protein